MSNRATARRSHSSSLEVTVVFVAVFLVAGYASMRYGKLWGETDTNVFAVLIRAMVDEAKLVPVQRVYPNGYGFPVLATYLVSISGLSVTGMQLAGGALLAVWVVLPVWLAYRELVGSARGATLATVLILIQPEFLFPILRGTHEKFTRGLMFLCLFLLVRSILARQTWRRFAALLLGFYLASYALITFNNLLATSFIVALGLALVLGLIMRYLIAPRSDSSDTMRRLLYAVSISLLLAFLFTFYAYPPARHGLRIVESVWDRMAMLFLDVEEVAANPYHTLTTAWVSFPVYLIVSIANWLLLIASFVLWIVQTHTWWRKRTWPEEPRTILLWSLYGAFGFLGAVSILVDVSGAIALNLQHRIFPSFAMIAAPFVTAWSLRQQTFRTTTRPLAYGLLVVVISFLSVVAVAKATNEPLVSNRWVFSTPAEFTGLDWARQNNPNGSTWAAFDSRLRASTGIQYGWETQGAKFDSHDPAPSTRTHLISDVMRARSERLNLRLPIEGDSLRVYDNGAAELYHLRPRTPYQK